MKNNNLYNLRRMGGGLQPNQRFNANFYSSNCGNGGARLVLVTSQAGYYDATAPHMEVSIW